MSKFLKFVAWTALAVLMASLVMGGLLMGLAQEGLNHAGSWHVMVDGEDMGNLIQLGDLDTEQGFAGLVVAALALGFTLVVVLPLVLLFGIGLPILMVVLSLGLVALVLTGVSALIAAPLLLPALLVYWLIKRDRRPPTRPASA